MKNITAALAIVAFLAATAAAQPKKGRAKPAATAKEAAPSPKKARFYDFTGDNIDGDRIRPDGTTIFGLNAARHGSLIKLRGDFVREIVKSAERL